MYLINVAAAVSSFLNFYIKVIYFGYYPDHVCEVLFALADELICVKLNVIYNLTCLFSFELLLRCTGAVFHCRREMSTFVDNGWSV